MESQNEEEIEKFNLFQKEIFKERDFLGKIKDIFRIQYEENFQNILTIQKNKFTELIENEVISILKNLYSEKIILNRKFNSMFKNAKEDFGTRYNYNYEDISSEWENFNNLKDNINKIEEKINAYYITDFRRHCHYHEGIAIHKCGDEKLGKFIKIYSRHNFRFRNCKEGKYIICEQCKKVFCKEFFNSYCSYCKENYLCNILAPNENKECFLATYSSPHCESLINKIIPCKLCKEKMYLFINEKILKCLKCSFAIDLNNKDEFQWQCPKCYKYFKSNVKIFNSSENYIFPKIIKKAILLKNKAHPKFMNCCNINKSNTTFFHTKDCNGILYSCNIENYLLCYKDWVIVCDKCQTINNYENFIWTCPKCGKRARDLENECEEVFTPTQRKYSESNNYTNKDHDENNSSNNNYIRSNLYRKYLSNYVKKKPYLSPCSRDDKNFNNKKNEYDTNTREIYKKKEENKKNDVSDFDIEKENSMIKVNVRINERTKNIKTPFSRFYLRAKKFSSTERNNPFSPVSNNITISNNSSINSVTKFKSSREKYKNLKKLKILEENPKNLNQNSNNNINKDNVDNNTNKKNEKLKKEKSIPLPRINYMKNKNSILFNYKRQEEDNKIKVLRAESYKSSNNLDEKEEKVNTEFNKDYFSQENKEENQCNINLNKRNIIFNFRYKKNIQARKGYNNDNINKSKQSLKKSLEIEETSKFNKEYIKNEETTIEGKKRFHLYSVEGKVSNIDGRISKETTAHGSKVSLESSSKEGTNNTNKNMNIKKLDNSNMSNNNSKEKDYFYVNSFSFNFKKRRKLYEKEKEKINYIQNLKNIIPNTGVSNRLKNSKVNQEFDNLESNEEYIRNKINNKPNDIKEPSEINYSEDIEIYDSRIKKHTELYDNIQNGIKKILEKGRLPQFKIENYAILKKIGDGAFGVLFSVLNKQTRKKYALKKLTASDLNLLEELQKEFEIAYKSSHDNILSIYGISVKVYDSTTFAFFVLMDLGECDWEIEINKRFKEKNYYTEEELINILKQLTSALAYLQKNEIAHRDIKPENIILFREKENKVIYKICDFGEAKEKIKVNSRHKSIRGTDYYMSPILFKGLTQEQKFVKDNPYKSDVFSLGFCMIIACVLDFNFINKIRNVEEQIKLDRIIKENLEKRYSNKFINVLLKMVIYREKDRIDFFGLEELINAEL